MCSTRKTAFAILLTGTSLLALSTGCRRVQPPHAKPVALQSEPTSNHLVAQRDFRESIAVVPSGSTLGYSTRYVYAPTEDAPMIRRVWQEPALFLVNTAILPLTYLRTPPFTWREYPGLVIPATYTAQPVLEPGIGNPNEPVVAGVGGRFSGVPARPTDFGPNADLPPGSETPGLPDVDIAGPSD